MLAHKLVEKGKFFGAKEIGTVVLIELVPPFFGVATGWDERRGIGTELGKICERVASHLAANAKLLG